MGQRQARDIYTLYKQILKADCNACMLFQASQDTKVVLYNQVKVKITALVY